MSRAKNHHDERAEEILSRTLDAVTERGRARRRRRLAGAGVLGVMVAVWAGTLGNDAERATVATVELPPISLVSRGDPGEQVPLIWGEPWSLLLVMDGEGVEMRAMSAGQISALARKPGCEFEMSPEAVMIVSDSNAGAERFDFGGSF